MNDTLFLLKRVLKNMYRHKFSYIFNAAFLQFFMLTIASFVLSLFFKLILTVSGEANLNQANFKNIISNYWVILIIALMFLMFAFFMFFEYSMLSLLVYSNIRETHFSLKTIIKNSLKKLRLILNANYFIFAFYCLLAFPFANFGISSVLLGEIYIPKFITSEMVKTNFGLGIYLASILILGYINFRLIFVMPITIISDRTILQSIRRSIALTEFRRLSWLPTIFVYVLSLLVILLFLFWIIIVVLTLLDPLGENLIYQTIFYTLVSALIFVFILLSKVGVVNTLVTVISDNRYVAPDIYNHKKEEKRKFKYLGVFVMLLTLGSLFYHGYRLYGDGLNEHIKVVGHRGYISSGVENSIESLEGAAKAGLDYAEIDVVMTKDNKFLIFHDNKLDRLAGIDKKVRESNFSEIVGLEVKQDGHKGRITSLEDFVKKSKELNIDLIFDLKVYGGEQNYAETFVKEVSNYLNADDYRIMSLDLKLVETINKLKPEIRVGYVIPILFGSPAQEDVDFYVIEDFSYNFTLAGHNVKDKEIYVWTLNDKDRIENYLKEPIAGIITDEPYVVKESKEELKRSDNYLDRLVRLVLNKL